MPVTRNQASSTNEGEEDTLQRLLHILASLQARNDEQSRLSAEAERRYRQAEERHRGFEKRRAQEREEELRRQLEAVKTTCGEGSSLQMENSPRIFWGQPFSQEIDETQVPPNFREVVVELFNGTQDPHAHLQAFQTQMYISRVDDKLSCKLFQGTLRGVAMQWMATLPTKAIRTFIDLDSAFASQFAANKVKRLEVTNLFDIKQAVGESLKSFLARFNNVIVRVNDPDQKIFIKTFQKGLKASPFSDSLALRRPTSMDEIRVRVEKHVEAEEDQAERMKEELSQNKKNNGRVIEQRITQRADAPRRPEMT
ncbi:hypothetical protein CR513_16284, partial [Mucuna pruriens]